MDELLRKGSVLQTVAGPGLFLRGMQCLFPSRLILCLVMLGSHEDQRPVGAAFDPQHMVKKVAHPERVSIWGCFASCGVGKICLFRDLLDAKMMRATLKD